MSEMLRKKISFCVLCTVQMYCQASCFVCIALCKCTARHVLFLEIRVSNLVFYALWEIREDWKVEPFLIMNGIASIPLEDLFVLMLLRVCVFRPKRYASVWGHSVHKNYSSCVEEAPRENMSFFVCISLIFDTIFVLPDPVFSSGWMVLPFLVKMVWSLNWTPDNLGSAIQVLLSGTLLPNSAITGYAAYLHNSLLESCCGCWSLLYNALLRSWPDSLRSCRMWF